MAFWGIFFLVSSLCRYIFFENGTRGKGNGAVVKGLKYTGTEEDLTLGGKYTMPCTDVS